MNANSENLVWFFISTMENILKVKTNYYLNEKVIIQPMCAFDIDLPFIGQLSTFLSISYLIWWDILLCNHLFRKYDNLSIWITSAVAKDAKVSFDYSQR